MSGERRQVTEPGERVYAPRPSWAPALFALGAALAVCGIFIKFMLSGWIYSLIGIVILLAALRVMIRSAVRDYRSLPRRQHVRSAVLPVETISSPPRPNA